MPVTCRKIDNSYRLVEPDGSVVSSAKHATLEACQKQAAAININQSAKSFAVAYFAPGLDAFELAHKDGLTFEKEIIYEGRFEKAEENLKFDITRSVLAHWHHNINEMLSNGVEIPVPTKHDERDNPELNRGQVVGSMIKPDKKGRYGLFAKIKFANEEAAKLADSANVSLMSAPKFTDGKGNIYTDAIIHVALTNYPVIPDLDGFQAIAASFGEIKMSTSVLLPIAQRMGIEGSDSMNDVGLSAAILTKFDELAAALKSKAEEKTPENGEEKPPSDGPPTEPTNEEDEEVKKKKEMEAALLESPIAASFSKIAKQGRLTQLDALVLAGNITKASRDKFEKIWCCDEALKLSMSDPKASDNFDTFVEALKSNKVMEISDEQRKRTMVLSNPQTVEDNPLVADANERAKVGLSN